MFNSHIQDSTGLGNIKSKQTVIECDECLLGQEKAREAQNQGADTSWTEGVYEGDLPGESTVYSEISRHGGASRQDKGGRASDMRNGADRRGNVAFSQTWHISETNAKGTYAWKKGKWSEGEDAEREKLRRRLEKEEGRGPQRVS